MWAQRTNNYLCNYLELMQDQKKHIERILSARENINNDKPYYPRFLLLKLGKNQFEEEKNIIRKEENKNLFYKIINAQKNPSKYSKIFEPKVCPSFNIKYIRLKRIKKQIENYHENERFYQHLESVKSIYDINDINKRNITIDYNMKKLQKSVIEMQPSLFFISPQNVKKSMKKIIFSNLNKSKIKRCNSCCNRYDSKNIINQIKNQSESNRFRQKKQDKNLDNNKKFNSDRIVKVENKIKKIISKPIISKARKNYKYSKTCKNNNKSIKMDKNINNSKKLNSSYDNNSKSIKEIKKVKHGLKRNSSEFNIFE